MLIVGDFSKRLGVVITALMLWSSQAGATSLAITNFFGVWRKSFVACEELRGSPFLEVEHNARGDFVVYGKKRCELEFVSTSKFDRANIQFTVANKKKCSESGFPADYIGTYRVLVDGHLAISKKDSEDLEMIDCMSHGLSKGYDQGNRKQ